MKYEYLIISECLRAITKELAKKWRQLDWENQKTMSALVDDHLNDLEQHLKFLDNNFGWVDKAKSHRGDVNWKWLFCEKNNRFRSFVMSDKVRF